VIELDKSNERFRMLYDTKGRFVLNKVSLEESKFKILKIVGSGKQAKNVPYVVSHDGRTLRYPDPIIKKNDSVKLDLATGKVRASEGSAGPVGGPAFRRRRRRRRRCRRRPRLKRYPPPFSPSPTHAPPPGQITEVLKFEVGNTVMVTKGRNTGRVGTVTDVEEHPGSFDIAHIKDASGHVFATRKSNLFTLGKSADSLAVALPRGKGIALDIFEQRDRGARGAVGGAAQ
jgi:ribosomal protein S4E